MRVIPVVAIVGPTASGKTSLALEVARGIRARGREAEIVNADASLVYRGMDIGTAKPSRAELAEVRHHLVDVAGITATASVADFQRQARAVIDDCRMRGALPLLVGGSALYIRAILDDFDFPGTDPALRARLEAELEAEGPAVLHARLQRLSPDAAAGILPSNGRRIVRALEVIQLTGSYHATLPAWSYVVPDVLQFGLELPRAELDARIEARVEQMWADGLVDEVRALEAAGLRDGRTASAALGYRQVLDFLAGRCSEAEARRDTVSGTRRFARKQLGWFRRDPRIEWLPAGDPDNAETILRRVRQTYHAV